MSESTTVTIGLDVHASSVRLAAIRGDELLDERTLPYDLEAVERVLRRWPSVRCCYEAGPTGFGLYRYLVERTFAWLHHFKRLLVRYDRRAEIHEAFLALGCCLVCFRRLQRSF